MDRPPPGPVTVEDAEREVTLRFLAAPTDADSLSGGTVAAGRVLEWIDKAAYACAVGWSGGYCVTVYVGNVQFSRPIVSGDLVEVGARLVHTGRTSMHIEVMVASTSPRQVRYEQSTSCTVVFVAVGEGGRPVEVPQWIPQTEDDRARDEIANGKIAVRHGIEEAMRRQTYSSAGSSPTAELRFLAAPTDVNWGGKTHGGTVMRWIDEASYVCATGWTGGRCVAVYSGGIRFYRPILIGHVVEIEARLIYTGQRSMHVSVHVRSGDPRSREALQLCTHSLTVFVSLDEAGRTLPVPHWTPRTDEDRALEAHAQELITLRSRLKPPYPA